MAWIHPADYGHDELRGFLWPQDRYVDLPAYIEDAVAAHFARCSELAKERGVAQIHRTSRVGVDIALEPLDFARRNEVDLIIVGSRGRGRLAGCCWAACCKSSQA